VCVSHTTSRKGPRNHLIRATPVSTLVASRVNRDSIAQAEVGGPLASLRTSLRREAFRRFGVPPALAETLFLLPFLGAAAVLLTRAHKPLFRFVTDEDSVLEWPQFVGFAAASIFAFACAGRLRNAGRPVLALAFLAFGLGCFFVAGEEIAWGQRVFGYGTPPRLEEINEQEEVTVHNIDTVQHLTNVTYLIAGLYGSIFAWIVRWRSRDRASELVDLLLPPLFLTAAFFVMFSYKLLRFSFFPESGFTVTRIGEWPELCLAFGFSAFAWLQWVRLKAPANAGIAPNPGAAAGSTSGPGTLRLQLSVELLVGVCHRPPVVLILDVSACGAPETLPVRIVVEDAQEAVCELPGAPADQQLPPRRDSQALERERRHDAARATCHRLEELVLDPCSTDHRTDIGAAACEPRAEVPDLTGNLDAFELGQGAHARRRRSPYDRKARVGP